MYGGYYLGELTVLQGAEQLKEVVCRGVEIPRQVGVGPHHLNIRK